MRRGDFNLQAQLASDGLPDNALLPIAGAAAAGVKRARLALAPPPALRERWADNTDRRP